MSHRIFIYDRKRHMFDWRVGCGDIRIASSNAVSFPGDGGKDQSARSGRTISQFCVRARSNHLTTAQLSNLRKYWGIIFRASADDHERRCRQVDMRTCRVHTMRQLGKGTQKRSMIANLYEDVSQMTLLLDLTSSESVAGRGCQILRTTYPRNKPRGVAKAQQS
jgi:hypothetical protein